MQALLGMPGLMGIFVVGFIVVIFIVMTIKVVNDYERAVVFRFGRVVSGPPFLGLSLFDYSRAGLKVILPMVDRMIKVDLRVVTLDVPAQEVITKDNITIRVNAVVYFNVMDPNIAILKVNNHFVATSLFAQTTLRNILGQHELDEILSERDKISQGLQQIIDEQTDAWGVKVSVVEIKDIELPDNMQRVIARQAEAERERRAKIIAADGEFQASARLADAARIIEQTESALQLRYLQTLVEISAGKTSTIIFPMPIDFMNAFNRFSDLAGKGKTPPKEPVEMPVTDPGEKIPNVDIPEPPKA